MRRRAEAVLFTLVLLAGAGWALRDALRPWVWGLRGAWELIGLPPSPPPSIAAPALVAHAGGELRGLRYTNALEALDLHYARGTRWFEIDLLGDGENAFWAVHDWREAHEALGIPLDREGRGLPREQHKGAAFRVPQLEEVLAWFAGHGDARLITDTKGDNEALLRRLSKEPLDLRARIHPQLYRIREYAQAQAAGLGAPIFTTYRSHYPMRILRRFALGHPLLAIAVTREQASEACDALSGAVPVLTHTVNDPADAASLSRSGIAGIYTDELLPGAR